MLAGTRRIGCAASQVFACWIWPVREAEAVGKASRRAHRHRAVHPRSAGNGSFASGLEEARQRTPSECDVGERWQVTDARHPQEAPDRRKSC